MNVRDVHRRTVTGLHTTIWPGAGTRTVVALPGLSSTAAVWGPLAESLPDIEVVAPDLRGRGGSRDVGGQSGLRAHARDVAALMSELDLRDVVLVGHSMGAYLAPVVAQEVGDRVTRLVLVDGGIPPALPLFMGPRLVRMTFRKELRALDRDWPTVEAFARTSKFEQMLASRPELRPVVLGIVAAELDGDAGALRPRLEIDRLVADAVDVFCGPDVEHALDDLKMPTTVLLAENRRRDGQRPFIADRAVTPWLRRQPLLSVRRLPGNHLTVLFAPELREAIAS
jgi:lipase